MKYIVVSKTKFELAYCNGCNKNACAGYSNCTADNIKVEVSVKV